MEKLGKLATFSLSVILVCIVWLLYGNVSAFKSHNPFPAVLELMETKLKDDGVNFTSVVLATDTETLEEMLNFHCSLPCAQKIIVVWNNLESPVEQDHYDVVRNCAVNVTVIPQRDNSINNQFKPFDQIETDVVFITQVGVTLSRYDLLLGLEAWKQFPHLLIGYSPWEIQRADGKYFYVRNAPQNSYNLMLSDAFLIHKKYLKLYETKTPILLYDRIHSHYNGDYFSRDLLMNIVIAEHLKTEAVPQPSCLWVKANSWSSKRFISEGDEALWTKRNALLRQTEIFYDYKIPLYDSTWIVTHKDDLNVFHRTN